MDENYVPFKSVVCSVGIPSVPSSAPFVVILVPVVSRVPFTPSRSFRVQVFFLFYFPSVSVYSFIIYFGAECRTCRLVIIMPSWFFGWVSLNSEMKSETHETLTYDFLAGWRWRLDVNCDRTYWARVGPIGPYYSEGTFRNK